MGSTWKMGRKNATARGWEGVLLSTTFSRQDKTVVHINSQKLWQLLRPHSSLSSYGYWKW